MTIIAIRFWSVWNERSSWDWYTRKNLKIKRTSANKANKKLIQTDVRTKDRFSYERKKENPLKDCPLNPSWDNLPKLRSGPSRTTSTSELNSAQPKLPNSSSKLARRKGQHHHSKTLLLPLEAKWTETTIKLRDFTTSNW